MKLWIGRPTSGLTLLLCTLAAELMELRGYSPLIHLIHVPLLVLVEFLTNRKHNKCGKSGARFSKAPKTFRACEAIFNCLYLENKEVCRH